MQLYSTVSEDYHRGSYLPPLGGIKLNIPQAQINAGKQALQALWNDTVTVSRTCKVGNLIEDIEVYKDIKCHLSQSSPPVQKQSDTVASTTAILTLHVDTDIVILQGDSLQITHKNQLFKGVAGQPFNRNFSNVIPLEVMTIS